MKTIIFIIALAVTVFGCASEQEQIKGKQIATCKEQIKAGQEPTEFCLNLLPEYRQVAQAQQQPLQQYEPQQYAPQAAPTPVIVQQPAAQSSNNGMTDMLVGGLIGHAIGSSGNNNGSSNYTPPSTRVIERNTTIIRQAPKPSTGFVTPATPKTNYMDTSKLSGFGARPSSPVKSSSMNMSKLGTYGKRK